MFTIRPAQTDDVEPAIAALGAGFTRDPLMAYLFGGGAMEVRSATEAFFSLLLRARLALGMPAFVVEAGGAVLGAAMGYDSSFLKWPEAIEAERRRFYAGFSGLDARLDAYGAIAEAFEPKEAHYYLGVLGIDPSLQRKGAGSALLETFCALSQNDPRSEGVFLETANPDSLGFYRHHRFAVLGEGMLGDVALWCLYRRT